MTSDYVKKYISEAERECECEKHPEWLQQFFGSFAENLKGKVKEASTGNRNFITNAFSESLHHILPIKEKPKTEVSLSDFLEKEKLDSASEPFLNLLNKKRLDFHVRGKKGELLIEFKTNMSFNDLAAAMVEMSLVKKYAPNIRTASLHLYPSSANVEGLRELNKTTGAPLDFIWVLFPSKKLMIDDDAIKAIKAFRNDVANAIN